MGASVDFSNGIKIIQEAHADAVAILEKWRDMLEAQGEIVFSIRNRDGSTAEITLPTIREAINRYLGGVFDQITLTDGNTTVIIRLDANGNVELVNANGSPANLIVGNIAVSRITGANGQLYIRGSVNLADAVITNGQVRDLSVYGAQINGAVFSGSARITGGTIITGNATIRNATVQNLDAGTIRYRKQVLQWATESITDSQTRGATSNGLWTGSVEGLERAGIFSTPTWCDCLYVPDSPGVAGNKLTIFWGEDGDIPVILNGSTEVDVTIMGRWPYKMYEAVDGGYRVRWLPLGDLKGRITYVRTGDTSSGAGYTMPVTIIVAASGTGVDVYVEATKLINPYECRRCIADYTATVYPGSSVETHAIYPM